MDSFLTTTTTSLDHRKQSLVVSKKPPKQKKKTTTTNKSIKVRYISNPMKVKTCASKFRELVQELTGQDAVDHEPEPMYFPSEESPSPPPCTPSTAENLAPRVLHQEPFDDVVVDHYEPLDGEEMFFPDQMSAGFSGFFSNAFYNVKEFESIDSM